MKNLNKLTYFLVSSLSVAILAGCINSGGKNTNTQPTVTKEILPQVYFDAVGVVPLDARNANFSLRLNSSYPEQLTLKDIYIIDPDTNLRNDKLAKIYAHGCALVPAKNSCTISYSSNLQQNGSFIIEAQLVNSKTNEKFVKRQFIRVAKVSSNHGLEFQTALNEVGASNNHFSMALPIYLDKNVQELKAEDGLNGKLICPSSTAGTACTYLIDGTVMDGQTSLETKLAAKSATGEKFDVAQRSIITTNLAANLLIGFPEDVYMGATDIDTKEFSVQVFNNGTTNAEISQIILGNHLQNNGKAGDCDSATSLQPGQACSINYKADKNSFIKNEISEIKVKYSKTSTILDSFVAANLLVYKGTIDKPDTAMLTLTANGNYTATPNGIARTVTYTLANPLGSQKITNIQIKHHNTVLGTQFKLEGSGSGGNCNVNTSFELDANTSCTFTGKLTGSAGNTIDTQILLEASGDYTDSMNGQDQSVMGYIATHASTLDFLNLVTVSAPTEFHAAVTTPATEVLESATINNSSGLNLSFSQFDFNDGGINDKSIFNMTVQKIPNNCTTGSGTNPSNNAFDLPAGKSCVLFFRFKPANAYAAQKAGASTKLLKANGNTISNGDIVKIEFNLSASHAANITGSLAANNYPVGLYLYNPDTAPRIYNYVYSNTGGVATNFNVAINGLPLTAKMLGNLTDSTTITHGGKQIKPCKTGAEAANLAAGTSCYVSIQIPDDKYYNAGFLVGSETINYNGQISYTDDQGELVVKDSNSGFSVEISDQWVNVTASPKTSSSPVVTDGVRTVPVNVTLSAQGGMTIPNGLSARINTGIHITNQPDSPITSCDINTAGNTCELNVLLPEHLNTHQVKVEILNSSKKILRTVNADLSGW